jgi:hypothetical protein
MGEKNRLAWDRIRGHREKALDETGSGARIRSPQKSLWDLFSGATPPISCNCAPGCYAGKSLLIEPNIWLF